MVSDHYGVRWIENYALSDRPFSEGRALAELYPDSDVLERSEHPFPFPHVRRFVTMLIEPQVYLNAVLRDFLLTGGRLVVRELGTIADLAALGEPLVFNCTGLGADVVVTREDAHQGAVRLCDAGSGLHHMGDANLMFPRRSILPAARTSEARVVEPNRDALPALSRDIGGCRRVG